MIIIGWGNRYVKDFGQVIKDKCSICSKKNYFNLIRVRDWFDFFFIPIFPYNTEYHLVCPHCNCYLELEDEDQIETLKEIAKIS